MLALLSKVNGQVQDTGRDSGGGNVVLDKIWRRSRHLARKSVSRDEKTARLAFSHFIRRYPPAYPQVYVLVNPPIRQCRRDRNFVPDKDNKNVASYPELESVYLRWIWRKDVYPRKWVNSNIDQKGSLDEDFQL